MAHAIILRDLSHLAAYAAEFDPGPAEEAGPDPTPVSIGETDREPGVTDLLAALEAAGAALEAAARRDEEARALAGRELAAYDALRAELSEAERALAAASRVRGRAETLAVGAFGEEARATATRVAEEAGAVEERAARRAAVLRAEAERLSTGGAVRQLLAERRREREAEQARAAAAERAVRRATAVAAAGQALAAGRLDEAAALLVPLADGPPGDDEVAGLRALLAREQAERAVEAAGRALLQARRECRRDPAAAIAALAVLDVEGLPGELGGHVFGCWLEACRRLCRARGLTDPRRYAPALGRGVVLARESAAGPYLVVSALGMGPRWPTGAVADGPVLRRARPLGGRPAAAEGPERRRPAP